MKRHGEFALEGDGGHGGGAHGPGLYPALNSCRAHLAFGRDFAGRRSQSGPDLKGGIHLTLGVDLDTALANAITSYGQGFTGRGQGQEDRAPAAQASGQDPQA